MTQGGSAAGSAGAAGWARRAGFAGAAIGVVAAGVAVERLTMHRTVRRSARLALDAAGPYGSLRGTPGTASAEDGTELYFETDEIEDHAGDPRGDADPETVRAAKGGDGAGGPSVGPIRIDEAALMPVQVPPEPRTPQRNRLLRLLSRRRRQSDAAAGRAGARAPQRPTVVFSHGYCLNQDVWHFQRAALRGAVRAVYWDQRSHGRSGRAPVGEPVSIDQLGRDLKAVLDAAVPEGPIVLVGHSMGGMTVMALADQYPEFVAERVVGAAFVGTSAGGLSEVSYGLPLPALGVKAVRRVVPGVLKALVAQTELVERGRRAAADLFAGLVKRYSFGSARDIDPGVARFAERLIESVPIDVVAEFYPAFEAHEKTAALAAFDGRPALVLAGDRDLLTPHAHSEAIAAALPAAELVILERTGHLAMLERPETVNEHVAELLTRTIRTHGQGSTTAPHNGPHDGPLDGSPDRFGDGHDGHRAARTGSAQRAHRRRSDS
ncbi:alpha/beta fold hydrolase [Streptomyces daliensis]|uniref:Alpha/beta hydrolase n=1 Tax=Streptomyces daliensis TaxID=299421 RepID=A0A8T4J2Z0_9ACTN|nr:alpha/beta hydrolase [Streptomyces daliensis]